MACADWLEKVYSSENEKTEPSRAHWIKLRKWSSRAMPRDISPHVPSCSTDDTSLFFFVFWRMQEQEEKQHVAIIYITFSFVHSFLFLSWPQEAMPIYTIYFFFVSSRQVKGDSNQYLMLDIFNNSSWASLHLLKRFVGPWSMIIKYYKASTWAMIIKLSLYHIRASFNL